MNLNNIKHETEIKSLFSSIESLHGKTGLLFIRGTTFEIKNINITINNKILGSFELTTKEEVHEGKGVIEFQSDNNFKIKIDCDYYKSLNMMKFNGLSINCKKGKCSGNDSVHFYSFVENLKIMNSIYDFETKELNGVQLLLYQNNFFQNINGYLFKEDTYSNKENIEEIWKSIYFLLKLYSAGQAFNNINCILSNSYCEISISRSNLDFVKNHYSCFYVDEKNNLLNFIKSSYSSFINKKDCEIAFYSFIHYMSILLGNNHDFDLMPSFIALEILAVGNGILLDDDTFLQDRLDKLLDDLKISKESLNDVFAEDLEKLNYEDYLRCLIEYRSKILHGVVVNSKHLSLLVTNFLTIILLKILNINCSIYLPLFGEIQNSKDFIDKFKLNKSEIEKNNPENNIVKIFKKDGELYLPLTTPSVTSSIQANDRYRIITFKTLGESGKCLRNIKIDKR